MKVVLPYPHKALWPNGRSHWAEKAREAKKHKRWAYLATLDADTGEQFGRPVELRLTVHPKGKGPLPDRDNAVAACKAYIDGIAEAIGINDRDFTAPIVSFGARTDGFTLEVVS